MFRIEDKYYLNIQDMFLLESKVKSLLRPDSYAGEDGIYHVSSLYFDDYMDSCMHETLNGNPIRKKYRIRIYENSLENAKLEIKEKRYKGSRKLVSNIDKDVVKSIIEGKINNLSVNNEAERIFYTDYETRLLRPSVIVSYDRSAYLFDPGNVRITFDRNIRASGDCERFGKKKMITSVLEGAGVVEVKYDAFLPVFISKLLENGSMNLVSNSKYVLCRMAITKKGESFI